MTRSEERVMRVLAGSAAIFLRSLMQAVVDTLSPFTESANRASVVGQLKATAFAFNYLTHPPAVNLSTFLS